MLWVLSGRSRKQYYTYCLSFVLGDNELARESREKASELARESYIGSRRVEASELAGEEEGAGGDLE